MAGIFGPRPDIASTRESEQMLETASPSVSDHCTCFSVMHRAGRKIFFPVDEISLAC